MWSVSWTEQGMIVRTTYSDGKDHIVDVRPIHKFEVFNQEDIDQAKAQMLLEGK